MSAYDPIPKPDCNPRAAGPKGTAKRNGRVATAGEGHSVKPVVLRAGGSRFGRRIDNDYLPFSMITDKTIVWVLTQETYTPNTPKLAGRDVIGGYCGRNAKVLARREDHRAQRMTAGQYKQLTGGYAGLIEDL